MSELAPGIERIDQLLQDEPVEGFRLALALVQAPPVGACDHARSLDSYATACRVFGDLARAEELYEEAHGHCQCERCLWDRLRRLTYLRVEQGEPELGGKLAAKAIAAAPNRAMSGRCRVAAAYARFGLAQHGAAIETARQALVELEQRDLLYSVGALTTIGFCAARMDSAPEDLLRDARAELGDLRRSWPRKTRYRSARGKVSMVVGQLGYQLRVMDPWQLRAILMRVQGLHVELGLWRDAVQITAETASICSEMRREDLVARTIEVMLDALPKSLPRHVNLAVRGLRESLQAVDRGEVAQAASNLRASLLMRSSRAV